MRGDAELEEKLRPWLGRIVEDPLLAHWLRENRSAFIIGSLLEGQEDAKERGELFAFETGRFTNPRR